MSDEVKAIEPLSRATAEEWFTETIGVISLASDALCGFAAMMEVGMEAKQNSYIALHALLDDIASKTEEFYRRYEVTMKEQA